MPVSEFFRKGRFTAMTDAIRNFTADEQHDQDAEEHRLNEASLIQQTGSVEAPNARHLIHCLNIIGQIEGHDLLPAQSKTTKYEHILPALVAVEQDRSIEGLLILVNTVGGDVEAGLAIAEMIAGMKTPTVSLVIGGGHSIGVPLAVCAKCSMIVPSASMTLHPVRTSGLVLGTPQTMTYLMQIQDRITSFITRCSRISEQRLLSLMHSTSTMTTDMGTILSGREAVSIGLIDQIGSIQDALSCLYQQIETGDKRYAD